MKEQNTTMSQSNVSMSMQNTNELVALHNLIRDIAQKTINNCINIPRIYTMVCYEVLNQYMIKAVFPQDIELTKVDDDGNIIEVISNTSKVMTFPNYSGRVPIVGQGILVLTTGGTNLTGGFVIAIMGAGEIQIDLQEETNANAE